MYKHDLSAVNPVCLSNLSSTSILAGSRILDTMLTAQQLNSKLGKKCSNNGFLEKFSYALDLVPAPHLGIFLPCQCKDTRGVQHVCAHTKRNSVL